MSNREITSNDVCGVAAFWALDMSRAIMERPKWMRPFLRFFMGRYAFREFVGMCRTFNYMYPVYEEYGCEETGYNGQKVTWSDCYEAPDYDRAPQ